MRAILAVLLLASLVACGRTGPPPPEKRCVKSHVHKYRQWVPMSPGGMFVNRRERVCDQWVTVR
jgi:hypothetical protein